MKTTQVSQVRDKKGMASTYRTRHRRRLPSYSVTSLARNWTPLLSKALLYAAVVVGTALIVVGVSKESSPPLAITEEAIPELIYELVLSSEERPKVQRYAVKEKLSDGSYQTVTSHRWMSLLVHQQQHTVCIASFTEILAKADMKAFFFETKGVSYQSAQSKAFEFVLIESAQLYQFADAQQDPSDFGDKLQCGENAVGCVFRNLGGDSTLIAPTQVRGLLEPNNVYGHLAAFVRRAPPEQVLDFWKLTLETVLRTLEEEENPEKPFWFSTDGTGVKWLHMRIDPKPKYYEYRPFAQET